MNRCVRLLGTLTLCGAIAGMPSACGRRQVSTEDVKLALTQYKAAYEQGLAKIEADSKKALGDWPGQYEKALKALERSFQQAGDLDGLMAVRKEMNRFAEAKQIPGNALVQKPKELVALQKKVFVLLQSAEMGKNKQVQSSSDAYTADLENLEKALTEQGKIDDALTVKAEADGFKLVMSQRQRPPTSIKMIPAVKMDTPIVIETFGSTDDRESVDIVPQVSGLLKETLIKDGEVVTNGQPLFLIDQRDYAARVSQAEGMVRADRANVELSRLTVERNQPLLEKRLISQQDFDTLQTKKESVAAQLQMDEAALDQARLNLSRCTITAPLAGVCSKCYLNDGNLVVAGVTRLLNIRSYDPMNLELSVSEQYLPLLRNGMAERVVRLEITPQNSTNRYAGALNFIDNSVNPMTGTILLRGQVPNADLALWSHQFVDVVIFAGVVHDAVMVPEGAVQFGKMGPYLFAVKEGKADMRQVKTGARYKGLIQIVDGVMPEENVVVLGQLTLFPGAPVAQAANGAPQGQGPGAPAAPAGKDKERRGENKSVGGQGVETAK